jgi:DAPG hydrolase PhiG domain
MSSYGVPESAQFEFANAAELLDPAPRAVEMGVVRCPSGVLFVAARTEMPGCNAHMFEWWFRFVNNTERFMWWHPLDHVALRSEGASADTHIGATHIADQRPGPGLPVQRVHVLNVEPSEFFGDAWEAAIADGSVSGGTAGMTGAGDNPPRDDQGRPNTGRVAHVARDTADGMVLRSHFWMGEGTALPADVLRARVSDEQGLHLMAHCYGEYTYLARFLPSLYAGAFGALEGHTPVW